MLKNRFVGQALYKQLSKRTMHTNVTKIGLLGVPFDKGQPQIGVANAPNALRNAGLIKRIKNISDEIGLKDYGDISYDVDCNITSNIDNMKGYAHVASCTKHLSEKVSEIISDGRVCLTLGGDHSIGIGTVDGHLKSKSNNVSVIWVDAHADINTNLTSETGNVHGMPLAILIKELSDYWPYLPGMDWQKPMLSVRNIAYIGLRDVDKYERLIIDKLGIAAYGINEIEKHGIHNVIQMALEKIDPLANRSLHVSFDIDSLDELEAPSTGVIVPGGLTLREGIHIMETIHDTGRLNAIDMVEIFPNIGNAKDVTRTLNAAINIIIAGLGFKRQGFRSSSISELPLQTKPSTTNVIV